jgi:hypothetical protein
MTWQSVGQHTFVPTDKAVQVGSFDLAAGQDTIWVKITQLNNPGDWPWSYGILSWRNANGTPLGSVKAYSNRLGEVFRLGVGLPPSDGTGSIWFEPRGYNLGWLKAGFPWELSFEAQSGSSSPVTSSYWNRDPGKGSLFPADSTDSVDIGGGDIELNANGTATFGQIRVGENTGSSSQNLSSCLLRSSGYAALFKSNSDTSPFITAGRFGEATAFQVSFNGTISNPGITLYGGGSATFAGDVSAPNITFRSADPSHYQSGKYLGPELDLLEEIARLESLVRYLYETLRLAPPAGWEVWDGSTKASGSPHRALKRLLHDVKH